jgi:RimJ/RimL family protein N-acetyltransferase
VNIGFRPLTAADLRLVEDWLHREHVARWWRPDETSIPEYVDAIEGRDPTDLYVILLDARPVGLIQTYLVSDHPDYEAILHVGEGVAGVDLFIGEDDLIGRGLGVNVLRAFTRDVVFSRPGTHACIAGVEPDNTRSLRAFEKAGFRPGRLYEEEGRPHRLMRLEPTTIGAGADSRCDD